MGIADGGYVAGSSLEELVEGVRRKLSESSAGSVSSYRSSDLGDLARSIVIQSCRPAPIRSVKVTSQSEFARGFAG